VGASVSASCFFVVALLLAGCGSRDQGAPALIDSLLAAGEIEQALFVATSARKQKPLDPEIYSAWLLTHLHVPTLVEEGHGSELLAAEPVPGLAVHTLTGTVRHSGNNPARINAIRLLGRHVGLAAAPHLRLAADDANEAVRRAAVRQLGNLRDPAALTVVLLSLKDSSWAVRAEAVSAYGAIAGPAAIPRLATLLEDRDGYVRFQASKTLLDLARPGAEPAFRALCDPARSPESRELGALGLAKLGAADAPDFLRTVVIGGCIDHRAMAAGLLAEKWPERAGPIFIEALATTSDPGVGLVAARFLDTHGDAAGAEAATAYRRRLRQSGAETAELPGKKQEP